MYVWVHRVDIAEMTGLCLRHPLSGLFCSHFVVRLLGTSSNFCFESFLIRAFTFDPSQTPAVQREKVWL